jgi:signal transduction histidine kinase/CheY-like chemotaxis protein/AraC-like DNA-binding protein
MAKSSDVTGIYDRELRLLEKVREILTGNSLSKNELFNEYCALGKEYERLVRQAINITRIGDATQKKLMRSWELEQEKRRLEQVVKERTEEIEEKNRQLEQKTAQLEEQSDKLKELDQVKSRFFANISHEFRTPLTLIIGPLEQMLFTCDDNEQKKKLNLMLRNSQRLLGLINQLLDLSKFESGNVRLQAGWLNIIPFLKGIAASFEPLAVQKEVDLTFSTEEEDITLYFDPEKLEEILFNLLSNAVKFTPAGGKISVLVRSRSINAGNFPSDRVSPLTSYVEISVCDTGPGIPREQLDHIFDRFYQSDSTYEYHQKGSGIGLALAKELVELHHGTIEAHTWEGENIGTEFIIRFPMGDAHLRPDEIIEISETPSLRKTPGEILAFDMIEEKEDDSDSEPGTIDSQSTAAEGTDKNIILLVEDSRDVREYVRAALEPLYTVVEAKNGEEGIQKAQDIIPDLIISDIMMSGIDGYELCRVLKNHRNTSHVPIILLTAKAGEADIIEGLETGADDYITKPFNTKILCARIKNLVDLRRYFQQTMNREMTLQPTKMTVLPVDKEFINDLKEVIEKNIKDPDFNVEELCKKLYMSHATLYRKIHALTGESPTEFIRSYRLKRGAELLKNNFGTVLEVAMEVGFSSANYFTKCFKKKFHQLPSAYQAAEVK